MQLETWHEDSNILTRTRVDLFSRGIFALPTGLNIRIVELTNRKLLKQTMNVIFSKTFVDTRLLGFTQREY